MNRDQKAVAIEEIAGRIDESEAIFAVDYRGISVAQVAELRAKLREADAVFKVVKNSLTERAADKVDAEALKDFLTGPTALTFVRGDAAVAAKALADYGRSIQLLPFKGGLMEGAALDADQIRALSRLPSREVLYGQLVGVVASPVSGLVRTLAALLGGLAVALGQVREKKESGEIPAGESPAPAAEEAPAAATPAQEDAPAASEEETPAVVTDEQAPAADAQAPAAEAETPAAASESAAAETAEAPAEADGAAEGAEEIAAETEAPAAETGAEPAAAEEPTQTDDHEPAPEAESQPPADDEPNTTKED